MQDYKIYRLWEFSISQIWFHEFEKSNKQPLKKRPTFLRITHQQSWHEAPVTHQLKPSKATEKDNLIRQYRIANTACVQKKLKIVLVDTKEGTCMSCDKSKNQVEGKKNQF